MLCIDFCCNLRVAMKLAKLMGERSEGGGHGDRDR